MFNKASEFTMQDSSSEPYAWMIEGVDEVGDVESYVREYAKTAINTQNDSKAKDSTVYKVWRASGEFEQAVRAIKRMLAERQEYA